MADEVMELSNAEAGVTQTMTDLMRGEANIGTF